MAQEIAVVTGAGGGLGRALAVALCQRGCRVAGFGRTEETLEGTRAQAGEGFVPVVADVSDPGAVAQGFAQVRRHGPVSRLINNAAVYPHRDLLDETPVSFQQTMATNLGGTVACTLEALQDMTKAGRGRIVNVSSFADLQPLPCSAAYAVSKGAVTTFSRALVADLGDRLPNIIVTTWMPGMLNTQMGLAEGLDPAVAADWGARLALRQEPSLNGAVFERDREVLPARGLKARLKDALRLRRPKVRQIPDL
ncbi:SDR family oxidoreductase [Shimia marina]|uniref:2-(R)-hydroxypropyl-CoM dehydrogenase n=1 Tax=Shimia marina TaxID=321267 RepID=A0A0P1EL77_9RHOB|nr:SDR family oxidoreductase [Shimia marina]CUH51131.1 2-(R)-hydroxypropyl-CoM dehydrogenase [Shimia marina]SFD57362.1 Short-chain dehydrogenase [Shimia marina]